MCKSRDKASSAGESGAAAEVSSKETLAGEEAVKLKKLMGAVRYLLRNGDGAKNHVIADLKSLLKPSPSRVAAASKSGVTDGSKVSPLKRL